MFSTDLLSASRVKDRSASEYAIWLAAASEGAEPLAVASGLITQSSQDGEFLFVWES